MLKNLLGAMSVRIFLITVIGILLTATVVNMLGERDSRVNESRLRDQFAFDRVESMIQLNIVSVTRLAHAAAKAFAARDRGAIVNIASVVGLAPELQMAVYGATKAYVTYFTQSLRLQLSPNIHLQAVLPGATRTEIWDRSGSGGAESLDPNMLMEVDDLVDAALAGFFQGELITIPSLPDAADFAAYDAARVKLLPNLSRDRSAERYRTAVPA